MIFLSINGRPFFFFSFCLVYALCNGLYLVASYVLCKCVVFVLVSVCFSSLSNVSGCVAQSVVNGFVARYEYYYENSLV